MLRASSPDRYRFSHAFAATEAKAPTSKTLSSSDDALTKMWLGMVWCVDHQA